MYQHELARSGKFLFVIRGAYIYATIAGAIAIMWVFRDFGPFATEAADRAWFIAGPSFCRTASASSSVG